MANIMKVNDELKFYRAKLKSNEEVIADLTKDNKHIKEHIKFLQKLDAPETGDSPETNQWDAPDSEQS